MSFCVSNFKVVTLYIKGSQRIHKTILDIVVRDSSLNPGERFNSTSNTRQTESYVALFKNNM